MIAIEFLAEWALRSSMLILGGALLLRILRLKDPTVRLAAWTATLGASLAIPVFTAALPEISLVVPEAALQVRTAAPRTSWSRPLACCDFGHKPIAESSPTAVVSRPLVWPRAALGVYLLVTAALLLRLSIGFAMSRRLLRSSRPTGQSIDGIQIRESDRLAAPVVLGIARSVILLPADWRQWEGPKLAAVLAHERSHIRRRDPAVQFLSAIHRALLWHSPLSWFLHRRIVRLAEEASDDAAVAAVPDRASYAEMLLDFIRRGSGPVAWQGVGMARYGRPEERIHRILEATTISRGLTRGSLVAILALASPLAYLVAAAHPQTAPPAPPAAPMAPAPASPAAPAAPAPPVSPGTSARTIRRYMIVSGDNSSSSWDSNDPVDQEDLRARFGRNFAWFRQAGSDYVITDAGVLAEFERAGEPQRDVNRMQTEVNRQQDLVNSMQSRVNKMQDEVNRLQDGVNRRQDLVNRIQSSANTDDKEALIKNLQAAINELQSSKSAPDQQTVNRQQSQVNEEQHKVNDAQNKVNEQQSRVNAEQKRVSAEFSRRIEEIFESALRQHKAQQLM
jgi:beta-lactamase regulating signal transducer with metallopeptidase domain